MTFTEKQKRILEKCELFRGLDEKTLSCALNFFAASLCEYKKGECLQSEGEKMSSFGLVLCGTVQVFTDDINGERVIMANVTEGDSFGESLCFTCAENIPVCIYAFEDTQVLWLSCDRLHAVLPKKEEMMLYERFSLMLARRALSMNDRIQILSKLTIREKLNTFFSQCVRKNGSKTFNIPFDRENLAIFLGVNRSALSRELSAMQKEGLIEYYKSSFKIL